MSCTPDNLLPATPDITSVPIHSEDVATESFSKEAMSGGLDIGDVL
jgi:hypothetical protein